MIDANITDRRASSRRFVARPLRNALRRRSADDPVDYGFIGIFMAGQFAQQISCMLDPIPLDDQPFGDREPERTSDNVEVVRGYEGC
ncbi:hypothetical protein [Mesorhizobium caraganae]|uniref:hypothetical protein n=1 Tax=Mesorhizobium caraganae TaxID=483206 RepID=UPI003ED13002